MTLFKTLARALGQKLIALADTPDTPTIQTLVDLFNTRADLRRTDRSWTAADTLKNVIVKLKHPDGTFSSLAIGLPGDRDVDIKRLEAQVSPAEVIAFEAEDFAALDAYEFYAQLVAHGSVQPWCSARSPRGRVLYATSRIRM